MTSPTMRDADDAAAAADHGLRRVGVVGGGLMGSGIAEVHARAGLDVVLVEVDVHAAGRARSLVESSLTRAHERGKLDSVEEVLARVTVTSDLDAVADRDLVVEAVVEDERVKTGLFGRLDRIVTSTEAVLGSNTSSLPITRLAAATARPEQVLGVHFFNPAPVLALVELVPGLLTAEETLSRVRSLVEGELGKQAVVAGDRAGFVVNALLVPFLLSAVRMVESGFAGAEDVDRALVLGASHPMGPLALADLIGLDTVRAIADSLYEEFKEPTYAAPPLLSRMVDAGLLGRKSGRGFHRY